MLSNLLFIYFIFFFQWQNIWKAGKVSLCTWPGVKACFMCISAAHSIWQGHAKLQRRPLN